MAAFLKTFAVWHGRLWGNKPLPLSRSFSLERRTGFEFSQQLFHDGRPEERRVATRLARAMFNPMALPSRFTKGPPHCQGSRTVSCSMTRSNPCIRTLTSPFSRFSRSSVGVKLQLSRLGRPEPDAHVEIQSLAPDTQFDDLAHRSFPATG